MYPSRVVRVFVCVCLYACVYVCLFACLYCILRACEACVRSVRTGTTLHSTSNEGAAVLAS